MASMPLGPRRSRPGTFARLLQTSLRALCSSSSAPSWVRTHHASNRRHCCPLTVVHSSYIHRANCTVNADRATFSWREAGIGAPLASHADFERVGGHCRPNEVITGVTFKRAGAYMAVSLPYTLMHALIHHALFESTRLPSTHELGEQWTFVGLAAAMPCQH